MKIILKVLAVIGTAVIYRFLLFDFTLTPLYVVQSTYIFREIVGFAIMFQIVPSVLIKAWNENLKKVI